MPSILTKIDLEDLVKICDIILILYILTIFSEIFNINFHSFHYLWRENVSFLFLTLCKEKTFKYVRARLSFCDEELLSAESITKATTRQDGAPCWTSESARATSAVYPFPLITEQRKRANTGGDSAKRLSTRTYVYVIPRSCFFFFLLIRFLLPRGNYALMILNLLHNTNYAARKIKRLQSYCVIFNCYRLFLKSSSDFVAVRSRKEKERTALSWFSASSVWETLPLTTNGPDPHAHVYHTHYRTRALMRDP